MAYTSTVFLYLRGGLRSPSLATCQSVPLYNFIFNSSFFLLLFFIMSTIDKNCTYLISTEKSTTVQQEDICKDLESNEINNKIR